MRTLYVFVVLFALADMSLLGLACVPQLGTNANKPYGLVNMMSRRVIRTIETSI